MKEEILEYLYKNNTGIKIELNDFLKTLLVGNNQKILQPVLHSMEVEGLASFEGQVGHIGQPGNELESAIFKGELTAAGIQKAKEIKRRKWQDHLLERQTIISELSGQSVIATNDNQRKFSTRSLWLAAISTLFILITIILSMFNKTPLRLREIEKALRTQDTTLQNIRTSLEKIESYNQNKVSDTFGVKK